MLYQLAQDVELQDTQQHDGATANVHDACFLMWWLTPK